MIHKCLIQEVPVRIRAVVQQMYELRVKIK